MFLSYTFECSLEKIVSDAKQVEAEPSGTLLIHDFDMKKRRDVKIQKLVGNRIILQWVMREYKVLTLHWNSSLVDK